MTNEETEFFLSKLEVIEAGMIRLRRDNTVMLAALLQCERLFTEALPKFNWNASFLDANAIRLLNETPALTRAAIAQAQE